MDGNIDEVRSSHKGPAQPPSLVSGVRWIDDSTSVWSEKIHDGGGFLTSNRIDPSSNIIIPQELQRRNLCWNGDLNVWQDGTSEAAITATNNRIADGWKFELVSQGTWLIDRDNVTIPTEAQAGRRINYSMRMMVTTADGTVSAGDFAAANYTIEGHDYQELYKQPQHLSFWARSDTIGNYSAALRNSGPDRSFVYTFTIDVANTWELKEFVLRDMPSGGTWDFTTGIGLTIAIVFAAGSTFQTTANAWQNGNFLATSAQSNLAATINNEFWVADLRLHGGTVRNKVIIPTFAETLLLAQRRFYKTFNYATKPAQGQGFPGSLGTSADNAGVSDVPFTYRTMRAAPTITTYNPTQSNANWRRGDDGNDATAAVANTGETTATLALSAGTANNGYRIHATADARF